MLPTSFFVGQRIAFAQLKPLLSLSRSSFRLKASTSDETLPPLLLNVVKILDLHGRTTPLPPLNRIHHFVNLTNGIEAIPALDRLGLPYTFCRIPSTACEQQNFEILLQSLDPHLLTLLALGRPCVLWDLGCRTRYGLPRSFWMGIEFYRYSLARLWYRDKEVRAFTRSLDSSTTYEAFLRNDLSASLERRLRYYPKLRGDRGPPTGKEDEPVIPLYGAYRLTDNDSDFSFYVNLLAEKMEGKREEGEGIVEGEHPVDSLDRVGYKLFVPGLSKLRSNELRAQLHL